jgi:hypothetical protein
VIGRVSEIKGERKCCPLPPFLKLAKEENTVPDVEQGLKLNRLIGGILQGLREAKRLGDLESIRLHETYKENPVLAQLSVPAFDISEVEVELRLAIAGPSEEAEKEGEIPDLKVDISTSALKALESHQVQIMRLKFSPVPLRVLEESK